MADRVIFCRWDLPVPGREKAAMSAFRDSVAYCQRMLEAGEIEGHDEVLLDPHAGLGGFMLVKGEGPKLARMAADPEWIGLCVRGNVSMNGFGVLGGVTGEAGQQLLAAFQEATAAAAE